MIGKQRNPIAIGSGFIFKIFLLVGGGTPPRQAAPVGIPTNRERFEIASDDQ